eukprot:jgi/Tetstr1/444483/TSEL_032364.t1
MQRLLVAVIISAALLLRGGAQEGGSRDECDSGACTPSSSEQPWLETISWEPRAFVFHNFLTDEECDHIIEIAEPAMERSMVTGPDGEPALDTERTSKGAFLPRRLDPTITAIEQRVARLTHLPPVHSEDIQVLKYMDGQKYSAHYDSKQVSGSRRMITVLMYLSDVEEGGETAFPKAAAQEKYLDPAVQGAGRWSACAEGHVATRPKKGDALLFFSLHPDLRQDVYSLHTGCPVIAGTKWSATAWVYTEPFQPETYQGPLPPRLWECENLHPQCKDWAEAGECANNPKYMIGNLSKPGACRPACGACSVCEGSSDRQCIMSNAQRITDFTSNLK